MNTREVKFVLIFLIFVNALSVTLSLASTYYLKQQTKEDFNSDLTNSHYEETESSLLHQLIVGSINIIGAATLIIMTRRRAVK
jgi:hypothetical protein